VIAELRRDGTADDFLPGTIDTLKYDGHYVALPWGIDIRVWYYRKNFLAAAGVAPPANWAELRAAAKATTTADHAGIVGSGDTGGSHYIYALINNSGGGLFTPDRKLDFDNGPRSRAADEPRHPGPERFSGGAAAAVDHSVSRFHRELALADRRSDRAGEPVAGNVRSGTDLFSQHRELGGVFGHRDQNLAKLPVHDDVPFGRDPRHRPYAV
jgi:hypothetical protein